MLAASVVGEIGLTRLGGAAFGLFGRIRDESISSVGNLIIVKTRVNIRVPQRYTGRKALLASMLVSQRANALADPHSWLIVLLVGENTLLWHPHAARSSLSTRTSPPVNTTAPLLSTSNR